MIVYKITNTLNGMAYIGISSLGGSTRWRSHLAQARKSRPSQLIDRAIRKHGVECFTYEVLEAIDPKDGFERLEEREVYWIHRLQTFDRNVGYNLALGSYTNAGHQYSDERLAGARNRRGQPVKQCSLDGDLIQAFSSVAEAQRRAGVQAANIRAVAKGKRRQAGGFLWLWAEALTGSAAKKVRAKKKGTKQVYCFTPHGEFVCAYESAADAATRTRASRANISSVIKGKLLLSGGFTWSHRPILSRAHLRRLLSFEHKPKRKTAVVLYDADGKKLKMFERIGDAAKYTGGSTTPIGRCARGEIDFVVTKRFGVCRFRIAEDAPHKLPRIAKEVNTRARGVACYNDQGHLIATYKSLQEAAVKHNIKSAGNIRLAISGNLSIGGLRWRNHSTVKPAPMRIQERQQKQIVCQYNYHGLLVATFMTPAEAARAANRSRGTIVAACKGQIWSTAGHYWRFYPAAEAPNRIKTPPPRGEGRIY